ncbi:MAG: DUF4058 family protein [Planctomycetota bacterium]|nr:DUF4058 family protein [Planctomycetota bacterium]
MNMIFPGMDPYLEHPVLWESVHARLIVAMANHLQPQLDPRYVTSIEERVYIEGPQRRIPDLWIQQTPDAFGGTAVMAAEAGDTAVIVEVEELEVHETRVEILDAYNDMKLVCIVELVSPTNKAPGPGRESYHGKQQEILTRDCHLVEIDLLRAGQHVLSLPKWRASRLGPYDYLACVNRWPNRHRFELYPRRLSQRLPRIRLPLAAPDPDATLDLQATLEQVYLQGRYLRRIRYDQPCEPSLAELDQRWATDCWETHRASHPELFPPA